MSETDGTDSLYEFDAEWDLLRRVRVEVKGNAESFYIDRNGTSWFVTSDDVLYSSSNLSDSGSTLRAREVTTDVRDIGGDTGDNIASIGTFDGDRLWAFTTGGRLINYTISTGPSLEFKDSVLLREFYTDTTEPRELVRQSAGQWWLLDEEGVVHSVTPSGKNQDNRDSVSVDITADGIDPMDIYRGNDGYWWVLSNNGYTYRYDAEWDYTGVRKPLSWTDGVPDLAHVEDLRQDRQGNWWVLQEDGNLVTYDENWNYREKIRDLDDARYARSTSVNGETLYILRSGRDPTIEEYRLDGSGGISDEPVETHTLEAIEGEVDFHRSETGWWVLNGTGVVYKYTDDLSYTGEKKQIGSDSVIDHLQGSSDGFRDVFLLILVMIASILLPLIAISLVVHYITRKLRSTSEGK